MLQKAQRCASLLVLSLLAACTTGGTLLNSQQIERAFGSYGVDVLTQDDSRRISSLYSGSDG